MNNFYSLHSHSCPCADPVFQRGCEHFMATGEGLSMSKAKTRVDYCEEFNSEE